MSYAQRKQISGNRTAAIIIVAILHAILGYAIVTGLAYNVIKKAAEDLKTFDVEEEPPSSTTRPASPPTRSALRESAPRPSSPTARSSRWAKSRAWARRAERRTGPSGR